jgi:ribosome assembly protein YihI (activator of Der GTPase)
MQDESSKSLIEKNFSYELAMLFLTQLDYDRARIYIDKECGELLNQWKNLTKLSQVAQHFLVQKIQKIYEMNEFLNLIKDDTNTKPEDYDKKIQDITISMLNWS